MIVGGGKYGCHAIEFLRQKHSSFIVVDPDPNCQAVQRFKLKTPQGNPSDGENFVQGELPKAIELIDLLKPEYVFPTAPVHIAADMAKIKFKLNPWIEATNNILAKLPPNVVLYAGKGKLIVSFNRDHECIELCSMPETCPTSKTKKPCTMTKLMRFASPEAYILVSYSMAPGMGALKGSELNRIFQLGTNQKRIHSRHRMRLPRSLFRFQKNLKRIAVKRKIYCFDASRNARVYIFEDTPATNPPIASFEIAPSRFKIPGLAWSNRVNSNTPFTPAI